MDLVMYLEKENYYVFFKLNISYFNVVSEFYKLASKEKKIIIQKVVYFAITYQSK